MTMALRSAATRSSLKWTALGVSAIALILASGCDQKTRKTEAGSTYQDQVDATREVTTDPDINTPTPASTTQSRAAEMLRGGDGATPQQAKEFLEAAAKDIERMNEYASRAAWVNANFVTEDTAWLLTKASTEYSQMQTRLANGAKRFNDIKLPADMERKMSALKRGSNFPAPEKPGAAAELSTIMTSLDGRYAKGRFAVDVTDKRIIKILDENKRGDADYGKLGEEAPEGTIHLGQASKIIAESRDPGLLKTIWEGWRTISPPMASEYGRMVEIVNEGSAELGFADTGALWRGGYDMSADDFTQESERLWNQVKPLYTQLHCYVRYELNDEYGNEIVPLDQPIRADLLGNMWSQQWGNIYPVVQPEGFSGKSIDITSLLEKQKYTQKKMVETGEAFFTSLGFDPLPDTFWERSLITKPADRDVQCHASAWDIDDKSDVRIKMCTTITGEDFQTVHHELGHNIYQRAYQNQPVFYKTGANDGFHEAIGDMIGLSITPEYLVEIGLMNEADIPDASGDIPILLRQAMDKVAFLPFSLMVDKWRWQVFSGKIAPSAYNDGWWKLRTEYQGIRPPAARPAGAFDAGAKYHIPGNTPYMRYFLAHILQFQFHKAACDMSGFEGPLHRCSVYGNKEVGTRFNAMMEMGASKPWPDALEAFTGQRTMDGSALLEYFAPLQTWLEDQNEGRQCGWDMPQGG
nr:M2 family metallopeptidase [Robiginitomaculum antarcticum]